MSVEEARLTPQEFAGRLGLHPEVVPESWLEPDWSGAPSITVSQARALATQIRADEYKRQTAQMGHKAYLEERGRRRSEAGKTAADAAAERPLTLPARIGARTGVTSLFGARPEGEPWVERVQRAQVAAQAYERSVAEFDRKHPELDLAAWLNSRDGKEYR